MTVLPYLDIKATPVRSVELPRLSRTQSLPRIIDPNKSSHSEPLQPSENSNELTSSSIKRSSLLPVRTRTPKIKITRRTDELLKKLPHEKTANVKEVESTWKPLVRQPYDYDYLWDPLQREQIRHQYDFYDAPERILASRPDAPNKMTTMFETQDRHFHNYKRTRAMQQKQWNREHIQYTVFPYSQIPEREVYNKQIRSTLKEQMEEKIQANKEEQAIKSLESQMLIQKDRQDLDADKQRQIQRARLLFKANIRNKDLMESKWAYDRWNRAHQWHVERAILADDPINWSKTLT